jgi:hypothetical protein
MPDVTTLAVTPQPSWAGIITALSSFVIAVGGAITAVSLAVNRRRASARLDAYQRDTTGRLSVIHTLVNSTLTASLQAQLDSNRRELVVMLEMADMRRRAGTEPSDDWNAAIGALRRHIDDLSAAMTDRADQTRAADIQIADEAARKADERTVQAE